MHQLMICMIPQILRCTRVYNNYILTRYDIWNTVNTNTNDRLMETTFNLTLINIIKGASTFLTIFLDPMAGRPSSILLINWSYIFRETYRRVFKYAWFKELNNYFK
eukprot:GHVU01155187.1.p1 GENE.GHVU01155187.1~~GHVU01155187.1.p1  ORF type:complete len:106 (-),score=2.10 GHVU01155187.1:34-351(-)